MDQEPVVVKEGFSAVQGCLAGAVLLFMVLLGITITLAYRQFRENTGEPRPTPPPTSLLDTPFSDSPAPPSLLL